MCKHEYIAGVFCQKESGHLGNHMKYEMDVLSDHKIAFECYEWNDNKETIPPAHGNAFQVSYDAGVDEHEKIVELAIFDARKTLPRGVVFEIRCKPYPPDGGYPMPLADYGRRVFTRKELADDWGIAWYVRPNTTVGFERYATATEPLCRFKASEAIELCGYRLIARIVA